MSAKVIEIVTQRIIDSLEKGVAPWRKCWSSKRPCNFVSGRPYSGANALFTHPMVTGFREPGFLTFNQAKAMGASVRKGEKGLPIIFFKKVEGKKENQKDYFMCRFYKIFNVEQIDGLEIKTIKNEEPATNISAEEIIKSWDNKPKIELGIMDPCYIPALDTVHVPKSYDFDTVDEYYAAMFHELVHSTGHEKRLNRDMKPLMFDHHSYSKEELVAEIGAAFLCHHSGIESVAENQAAYCAHWLKLLGNDRKLIVEAAKDADKAFRMITGEADERSQENKTQEAA